MIPAERWKWFGMPGHLIVGDRCVHHLCTQIGGYLISTIGEYRPEGKKAGRETIGCDRFFETFVFNVPKKAARCDCGCNMPKPDYSEIDSLPANDAATADKNHMILCRKYARKGAKK